MPEEKFEFFVPNCIGITELLHPETLARIGFRYDLVFPINYALRTTAEQDQMADNLRIACDGGDDV